MLTDTRITFIGGGVMCEAIMKGLFAAGLAAPAQIAVAEPLESRRTDLAARYGVAVWAENAAAARGAAVIVLAVKPQQAAFVLRDLRDVLSPDALVISIMAGVSIATMAGAIGESQPIVRVMPNTPAQIGLAASGWTATPSVSGDQRKTAEAILGAMGISVYFDDEHYIDMVTGVSGSGPAFVFLFAEAWIDAAVRIGIPRPAAEKLVLQTLKGSIALLEQSRQHPAVLRNQVTSAGGTTAAGLHALEAGGLRVAVENAIEAAWRKSVELGAPH